VPAEEEQRLRLDTPRDTQSGSALLLVPVAMLILFVLAGLAVNGAATFLAQRELSAAVESAATDASSAISSQAFYNQGVIALDPAAAFRVADRSLTAQSLSGLLLDGPPDVAVVGRQVCVSATASVAPLIGGIFAPLARPTHLRATAIATARGDQGTSTPHSTPC
jgi:hypothetical protein